MGKVRNEVQMRCRRDANEMHDALPRPISRRYGARMATIGPSGGVGPKGAKKGRFWGGKAAVWGQNGAWGAKKAAVGQNWAVMGGEWGRMGGRESYCRGSSSFGGECGAERCSVTDWSHFGAKPGAFGGQMGQLGGKGGGFGVSVGGLGALWVGGTRGIFGVPCFGAILGVSGPPCWPLGSLGLQAALLHPSMLLEPHSPAGCQRCPKLTLIALIAC